jgi:hypothetical protein
MILGMTLITSAPKRLTGALYRKTCNQAKQPSSPIGDKHMAPYVCLQDDPLGTKIVTYKEIFS